MFNLQPGQGLGGVTASGILAFGLGIAEAVKRKLRGQPRDSAISTRIRDEDEEILLIISEFLFLEVA